MLSTGSGVLLETRKKARMSAEHQTTIVLSSGEKVRLSTISGIVVDNDQSSTTRVYSSGGGGYVGPQGGYVAPARVHSVTDTRQTIWIRDDKGVEHETRLMNMEVSLRAGQRVTTYWAQPESSGTARLQGLHNHTSQRYWSWTKQWLPEFTLKRGYPGARIGKTLAVMGLVACAVSFLPGPTVGMRMGMDIRMKVPACARIVDRLIFGEGANFGLPPHLRAPQQYADLPACLAGINKTFPGKKFGNDTWAQDFEKEFQAARATEAKARTWGHVKRYVLGAGLASLAIGLFMVLVGRSRFKQRLRDEYLAQVEPIISRGQFA